MSDTKTNASMLGALSGLTLPRLRRAMRLGIRSLWLHRLRSLLTMLGIVFGVCSVIAMLAIGEGASYEAQEQIKSLGSQNIIIRSSKPPDDQKASNQGSQSSVMQYGVTYIDAQRISETIPGVTVILPSRNIRDYVWNISRRVDCEIVGTVPWYPAMRNHRVVSGRFFTENDMDARASVCVLGAEMVPLLFPMESPLGRHIRVGGDYYQVIGIMEARGHEAKADDSAESKDKSALYRMFVPLETVKMRYGEVLIRRRAGSFDAEHVELHELTVKVASLEEVTSVADAIKAVMERNHKKKDYQIDVPLEMLRKAEHIKRTFNIVLGSIAAISLLVGGIGIMNIMLASVTERTREIGIRRALGARRRDIVVQFLVETVMLSGIGGILGVLLGVAIPFIVSYTAGMKTIITLWSPLLAFTISALVGVIFGIYPAIRAAKMDPVEALRHE
jgi:putative ABC transport system permease protein